MNKQILFKSALSLVAAVAAGSAFAVTQVLDEDFQTFSENYAITNDTNWSADGADESKIALDGSNKYLDLKTEGSTLTRSLGEPFAATAADPVFFEADIKFVPSDTADCGLVGGQDDTKFALYAYAPDGGDTNLVVFHAYMDGGVQYTNEVIDVNGALDDPEAFTKVSVKVFPAPTAADGMFFTIDLNGNPLSTAIVDDLNEPFDGGAIGVDYYPMTWFKTVNGTVNDQDKFSAICFKGTGAVDDLKVDLGEAEPTTFTVTLNAGTLRPYSLTTNGVAVSPVPASIVVDPNTEVVFGVSNTDGAVKTYTVTPTADYTLDASGATFGWPEYLGDAVDGAYEIDNLAELKLFQKGIATTTNELKLATAGETFKLTADIALDAAWPGIGVQNGKDIYSTADFNAAAFQGTFDGQNHTISGFQMQGGGLDYCGFFNSTYGATIQNLKIAYASSTFATDTTANSSTESGATFVGVAKNSTLRNLTTVAGTVSCDKGFGGIVGYLTSGTLVDSCTNNVNMTSLKPNKCGGIAMITQGGSAVTIINCQNNGSVAGSGEIGSLVGYIGLDTTISNFESTVAYKMFQHQGSTVTLQGTIKGIATVDSYTGQATDGLNFAIVDGNVATFVADGALAAGNTYKVMHTATATYEFAAAGSISFDTNMVQAVTFAITAAEGLTLTDATENGVVTYTAEASAAADWVDDPTTVSNQTAAVAYPTLAGTALAAADAQKLTVWAKANSVAFDSAEAATDAMVEAYLLNCAPTAVAIAAEKDAFVLDIEFDSTGAAVIKLPEGKTYNGTLQMKGSNDLSTWTPTATTQGYQFFKYDLSL